jgi:polygalacturonase
VGLVVRCDDYGAIPDGKTDSSAAFSSALRFLKREGGGTLVLSKGVYLSGPLELSDSVNLHLEKESILRFLDDFELYTPVTTRWEGVLCHAMHPLIFAQNASCVTISGKGTIDGSGQAWWNAYRIKKTMGQTTPILPIERRIAELDGVFKGKPSGGGGRETYFLRPPLIQFLSCERVWIEDVTIKNSPFWTIHPVFSNDIRIEHVKIENPSDAPNTDGIDIDSCTNVIIKACEIDVGDDCIALKAGSGEIGIAEGRSTRNVSISNCRFLNGHGAIVIGSETAGGVENVQVENCDIKGSDRGIRIKSRRGRGGTVQNLRFANLVMDSVFSPITINLYYNCGATISEAEHLFSQERQAESELTPRIRNVYISNLVAKNCKASAGFIVGLPESKIENLVLENCSISLAESDLVDVGSVEMFEGIEPIESRGIRMRHVRCSMVGVSILQCPGSGIIKEEGCDS